MATYKARTAASILLTIFALAMAPRADAKDGDGVSATIVVNASASIVWNALQDQRFADEFHRKIVSSSANNIMVEEVFADIPVLGSATCLVSENEVPCRRIDFTLVKSDKFKEFKGAWIFTPSADGKQTTVRLTTYCETGCRIPFARSITDTTIQKNERMRLAEIKELAEALQHKTVAVACK